MKERRLDTKIIVILILSVIACPILYVYEEQFSKTFRSILESKLLHLMIWMIIIIIYIIHYLKIRRREEQKNIILSHSLPPFMDNLFGAVTYGAIITSTLTLMKGVYIQITFGEEHFKDFSQVDISSLAIALFFLLWYSFTRIGEDIQEIFWIDQTRNIELEAPQKAVKQKSNVKLEEEK